MCDPITATAGAAMVTGGGLQAYGQIKAGEAANAAGIREQNNANKNADAIEGQARDAIDRGGYAADKLRQDSARAVGEGRAGLAASNVDLSSGSAAYWELDAASTTQGDVEKAKYAARQEAYGFRVQARNERARGVMARFQGKQAMYSGYTGAAGTVLATSGQTALMAKGAS